MSIANVYTIYKYSIKHPTEDTCLEMVLSEEEYLSWIPVLEFIEEKLKEYGSVS